MSSASNAEVLEVYSDIWSGSSESVKKVDDFKIKGTWHSCCLPLMNGREVTRDWTHLYINWNNRTWWSSCNERGQELTCQSGWCAREPGWRTAAAPLCGAGAAGGAAGGLRSLRKLMRRRTVSAGPHPPHYQLPCHKQSKDTNINTTLVKSVHVTRHLSLLASICTTKLPCNFFTVLLLLALEDNQLRTKHQGLQDIFMFTQIYNINIICILKQLFYLVMFWSLGNLVHF